MNKEDVKSLLLSDETPIMANDIPKGLLICLDEIILSEVSLVNISEDVFNIYKKFVSMKQEAPESMKSELFRVMNNFIKEKISFGEYYNALLLYRFLIVKSVITSDIYFNIAELLIKIGYGEISDSFIKLYETKETNKPLLFLTLANFYNIQLKEYKKAIKYYEKYLEIDKTKPVVYTIVGSLYAKVYGDFSLHDQIFYFKKAYNLASSDRTVLHGLAFAYEKSRDVERANEFYQKLLENNPTETDYFNYGAFLISCGDFRTGHKYFAHRFNINDENLKYPLSEDLGHKWDFISDISDKVLLVHYEQGFGDTFMYCRFVPFLKKYAKKIIFVVQNNLYDLINNSPTVSDGIEIVPDDIDFSELDYDVHMALLDVPLVLRTDISNIPYPDGYLEVSAAKLNEYTDKYIKPTGNIKVGISYSGDKSANYNGRDIEFSRFSTLLKLKGFDFYSLQADSSEEANNNIISLGSTFNNFTDTACAIKNMDIVISTDNVILNLAGALGVKTYGMFNKYPNFRWYKLKGHDVGWYSSVEPLQVEENNCWRDVFGNLMKILTNISEKKLAKK